MFFILTKINYAMIDILWTLFTYNNEGGSCDGGLWQALTKAIIDYIYNFNDKPLYMYSGQTMFFV